MDTENKILEVPDNCIVRKNSMIDVDTKTGEVTFKAVDRCVPLLEKNVLTIFRLGNNTKIVYMPVVIAAGVNTKEVNEYNKKTGWAKNDDEVKNSRKKESERTSLSRTKNTIRELVACNTWQYFVTITLSPDKWDRYTADEKLRQEITNCNKHFRRANKNNNCNSQNYKYLFIPELHADGAIHIHGFVAGIPENEKIPYTIEDVNSDKPLPVEICDAVRNGEKIYHCVDWDKRFGYNTLSEIKDLDRAASYMSKYVYKAFDTPIFRTKYWRSRCLDVAQCVGKFHIAEHNEKILLGKIYEMAAITKKGYKMYQETDTSVINSDIEPITNAVLLISALINNSEYSEKEIIDFIQQYDDKNNIHINRGGNY